MHPPTPPPHPSSVTLHCFILVHFSSQHWLPPDVWYLFLCLFAYCLSPPHVELRSGTLFCSLLRSTYNTIWHVQFSSVAQSCLTLCEPMNLSVPGLPVHHQLPEFTQTHVHRLSRWCHPSISSSVVPFSSCPQSLPASGSFPMSQLFAGDVVGTKKKFVSVHLINIFWVPTSCWPCEMSQNGK